MKCNNGCNNGCNMGFNGLNVDFVEPMPMMNDSFYVNKREFDCGGDQEVIKHQHIVKHHHDVINEYDVIHEFDINHYDVVKERQVVRTHDHRHHKPEYCGCGAEMNNCCGRRRRFW